MFYVSGYQRLRRHSGRWATDLDLELGLGHLRVLSLEERFELVGQLDVAGNILGYDVPLERGGHGAARPR